MIVWNGMDIIGVIVAVVILILAIIGTLWQKASDKLWERRRKRWEKFAKEKKEKDEADDL